jgi:hypothetical protein
MKRSMSTESIWNRWMWKESETSEHDCC